jgi:hypothetical protein
VSIIVKQIVNADNNLAAAAGVNNCSSRPKKKA